MYPEDFDDVIILDLPFFETLSRPMQIACLLHTLESEVNNGGFHQFLTNSSGFFTLQTIDALKVIGANKAKALLESAVDRAYPDGFPKDAWDHEEVVEDDAVLNDLYELDRLFDQYEDPLSDLVNQYLENESDIAP